MKPIIVAFLLFVASSANAGLITNEASWLSQISQDFTINVGLNSSGIAHSGTQQVNGNDIFSTGIGVTFSSPDAPDTSLVTVNSGHPELGAVSSSGGNWGGALRVDFDQVISAVGFGFHGGFPAQISLYDDIGSLISNELVNSASFIGIIENSGFSTIVFDTDHNFWSLDGGSNASAIVGQLASVPEPSSLALLGLGLLGLSYSRKRRKM